MIFDLPTFTLAKVTHVNKRVELHGQDLVHAKDIDWKIQAANTILDAPFPGLREALYMLARSQSLPGFQETTPDLRTELIDGKRKLKGEGTGYMLTIRYGEISGEQIELSGAEIQKFAVEAMRGGTVILTFQTTHTGLDLTQLGLLDTLDGKEVSILLAPPSVQDGTTSDSKSKKKKKAEDADTKTAALDLGDPANPFKYSGTGDGLKDNNPVPTTTDAKPPEAGDIFAAKVASGQAPAATPAQKRVAKKVAAKAKGKK